MMPMQMMPMQLSEYLRLDPRPDLRRPGDRVWSQHTRNPQGSQL